MANTNIGVLVMSYGTPESLEQVEAYYTHIRRGHPPTPEQLRDLVDRYEAIVGGVFPLRENTNKQVEALQAEFDRAHEESGIKYVCYQGLKHAAPFIEDGVQRMAQDGIKHAVGIVLAPHYSIMSVGGYINRAQEEAQKHGITMQFVKSYHLHPALIRALSDRLAAALSHFDGIAPSDIRVLFSAHSLPEKILEMKDPYPEQLLETSRAICEETGITNWEFAWQSAGRTATPWLGPDILDVLKRIKLQNESSYVIISPIGFVSDHLEVLYDIDIEAMELADQLGIHLVRTESLNTDPLYIQTLAESVISARVNPS